MAALDENDDVRAIRALIGAHFRGLQWTPGTRADWPAFAADFVPDASLFPAARPVRRQSVDAFIARMGPRNAGNARSRASSPRLSPSETNSFLAIAPGSALLGNPVSITWTLSPLNLASHHKLLAR